jgi:hypothetical protein
MIRSHGKAKDNFWRIVDAKLKPENTAGAYQRLRAGVNYMLDQMPVWLIDRATSMMKNWSPK